MKRYQACGALYMTVLFFVAGTAWAADRPASPDGTPAILASLNADNVTILDDQAAMAIRGQNSVVQYKYVLVKILGINALDGGPGVQWTWNPLGYRYGAWGGPGWSNGGVDPLTATAAPADAMDALFETHDSAYAGGSDKLAADKTLLGGLLLLPNCPDPTWGPIYKPSSTPTGLTPDLKVQVSGISLFGNGFFFGWKAMPYTEYARREAVAGMQALILGRSLLGTF